MPSPVANTTSVPQSQANDVTRPDPTTAPDTRNGTHLEGAVQQTSGATDRAANGSVVEEQDLIREGKEKAKAVLVASGVTLSPNMEQTRQNGQDQSLPASTIGVNGIFQSRKRSRSGSRIPSHPSSSSAQSHTQPGMQEHLLNQYVTRDNLHAVAMNDQDQRKRDMFQQMHADKNYYMELRELRKINPGAVYGYGYAGYGNSHTDEKPRLAYPAQRKGPANRRSKPLYTSRKDAAMQADQLEELVPVRLDIDFDKLKLRDTFTWNLHDRVITPEHFAESLVEDFKVPSEIAGNLRQVVNRDIQEQIQDYYPHVFIDEDPLDPHLPYHAYKNDEMRIVIKLNITIGPHTLIDQFEWEINNPLNNPEEFARQMARDLSLSGEFTTAIAHSIREQVQMFTRSLYITGHPFDGRPIEDSDVRENFLPTPLTSVFRHAQSAKEYTPYLYELNEGDLQREELSILREQRRQKRSVNRRGGPALPDLKDRQRTVRTLVISSVLPGAAESLETSRLFKLGRPASGRGRRPGAGRADDDSDDSDSEDSAPDSPMPSMQALGSGTARTRGIRGAAIAAQAGMKLNFGRSATPELAALHQHETRRSGRFGGFEGREESVVESTPLILRLKISPERYRHWANRYSNRRSGEYQHGGTLSTPLMASQNNTPQHNRSAASSMPPPPSPAMQQQPMPSASMNRPDGSSPVRKPAAGPGAPIQWRHKPHGEVESQYPQPPVDEAPPPADWMIAGLNVLHERYPYDRFECVMRWTAVDPTTGKAVTLPRGEVPAPHLRFEYQPRIRCSDCPGKLYTVGKEAGDTANCEVHLRHSAHRDNVMARRKGGG